MINTQGDASPAAAMQPPIDSVVAFSHYQVFSGSPTQDRSVQVEPEVHQSATMPNGHFVEASDLKQRSSAPLKRQDDIIHGMIAWVRLRFLESRAKRLLLSHFTQLA